jgi:hypothetical protein
MIVLVRPAVRHSAEHPLFVAEAWHHGRYLCTAMGASEPDARRLVRAEVRRMNAEHLAKREAEWERERDSWARAYVADMPMVPEWLRPQAKDGDDEDEA